MCAPDESVRVGVSKDRLGFVEGECLIGHTVTSVECVALGKFVVFTIEADMGTVV